MFAAILTRTGLVLGSSAAESEVSRFRELIAGHAPALQRLLLGYEASPEAQRDLYQEVLVALWRALPSFEGRSSLATWVFRIAHNVAASHVVKERRRHASSWRSLEDFSLGTGGEATAHRGSPPFAEHTSKLMLWHRSELERQRDLLRGVPLWYLSPFAPGILLTLLGAGMAAPEAWPRIALTAVLVLSVFVGVAAINLRVANKLDAQARDLSG